MSRKNVLEPIVLNSAQNLGASFVTDATTVLYQDNISYQINATTSDAEGTFSIEVSNDFQRADTFDTPAVGNWATLTLDGTPTLASANDIIVISLNQLPYKAVRLRYTRSSGTGTADVLISGRSIGS